MIRHGGSEAVIAGTLEIPVAQPGQHQGQNRRQRRSRNARVPSFSPAQPKRQKQAHRRHSPQSKDHRMPVDKGLSVNKRDLFHEFNPHPAQPWQSR